MLSVVFGDDHGIAYCRTSKPLYHVERIGFGVVGALENIRIAR
jgi:hypothetical protein